MSELAANRSEMDCKVFVDGAGGRRLLGAWIAESVAGEVSEDGVVADGLEMFVDDNDEAGAEDKAVRKRGFLFFDNVVEVYFAPKVELSGRIEAVSTILENLRRRELPAVAVCDYEDRLPRSGGTADSAPWPAHVGS